MNIVLMNITVRLGRQVLSIAVVLLGLCVASQAQLVFDNFDSYTNNQLLASTTSNAVAGSAWGRFGGGVADNPIAKTGAGVGGSTAMRFDLNYSGANNGNLLYYFSPTDQPSNLTSVSSITLALEVSNLVGVISNTIVEVAVAETNGSIYQTTASFAQVLTNTAYQTFTFALSAADMSNQGSAGAFDLSQVEDLRIRFQNGNTVGSETVYVDNFQGVAVPGTVHACSYGIRARYRHVCNSPTTKLTTWIRNLNWRPCYTTRVVSYMWPV